MIVPFQTNLLHWSDKFVSDRLLLRSLVETVVKKRISDLFVVNNSIGRLRIVVAKVVDGVNIRAVEEWENDLALIRSVGHVGFITCGKLCFGQWATVLVSCDRGSGVLIRQRYLGGWSR